MRSSRKTSRGLLLALALLTLPLAWACGSSAGTQTEETDPVAEAIGKATEVVGQQERAMNRAWAMAQVATAWSAVDPAAARQAVADSIRAAEEAAAGGDEQRAAAAELREKAATWAPADWRSAIAMAERIERNASRAWVLRAIAGELADRDPEQAASLLASALEIARSNPLPQYRAADESTVALEIVKLDPAGALEAAADIEDPAAKARALREMVGQLAEEDPVLAETALSDAVSAAREISDPYDRAWALRESSAAPGVDVEGARALLAEAEEAAGEITEAEPQAFALSDIAVEWAALDSGRAMAAVDRIGADHPEARVAALIGIGEARISASDQAGARSALERALQENESVLDVHERDRAVNVIIADLVSVDVDRAVSLARGIEDPYLQGEALRTLTVELAGAKPDDAISLAESIQPQFVRVEALIEVGGKVASTDQERAAGVFQQALSEAGDLKNTYPLRLLASAWAPLDPAKALEVANKVEDDQDRVYALTDVALATLKIDPAKAGVIFDTAYETAQKVKSDEDPFLTASVLRDLGAAWMPVDRAEATGVYAAAFQAAAAVPVETTG